MSQDQLTRELDKVKSQVFLGSNASILGSLMCSMTFEWDSTIATASTDGECLWWNPDWFLSLPMNTRKTVLVHELLHVVKLHLLRAAGKQHKEWNRACDISINNALEDDGYSFEGTQPYKDQQYRGMVEEDIYASIVSSNQTIPSNTWGVDGDDSEGDLRPIDDVKKHTIINNVVRAVHQANAAKQAGALLRQVTELVEKFMKPVVPWQTLLFNFFSALAEEDYSWNRPNRRYQDMYLPSLKIDETRLESLNYYFDVSGSVSSEEIARFNTEVRYIKETFNPDKLTTIQFDTRIQKTDVFMQEDTFKKLVVVGRGGTSLIPVRDHILETKPTAAIIFSDLYCPKMERLTKQIPVIWVAVGNPSAEVDFGKLIHIKR